MVKSAWIGFSIETRPYRFLSYPERCSPITGLRTMSNVSDSEGTRLSSGLAQEQQGLVTVSCRVIVDHRTEIHDAPHT